MSTKVEKATFEPLLNTKVKVTFDSQNEYEVELIKIIDGTYIEYLDLHPFTLVFKGPPNEKIFEQGRYKISSDKLEDVELFLIPRMPNEHGIYYECIIS